MAQAACPPSAPNPSSSTPRPALVPLARRSDAPPRVARAKDALCPTSSGGRGHSGQCKKAPDHAAHRSSGGSYSKPDARVKLIPVEEITYLRKGKPFTRSVGSAGLQKRHCRRSVTPPPNSRDVSLVRSVPLTPKPATPTPHVASPPSRKSFGTAQNRKIVSLNRPSPLYKAVQRGDPISFSSVHVKGHFSKVPLGTKTEPFPKSSTSKCQRTSSPSSSPNLSDGKCKLAPLQPEMTVPPTQSAQSTTPAQCVEMSNYFESVPSTKFHISNERQTDQDASVNCNMSSEIAKGKVCQDANQDVHTNCAASFTQGAPVILHTKVHKKPYRLEACWKGKFEVTGGLTHTCDGLEAHFPLEARLPEIFIKVYEASKKMPETLKLEALPVSRMLPKIFKMELPDGQDIGLCFISSPQRTNRKFDYLVEKLSSHIGLRTDIGTMELLIFSSKLLTKEDQTKDGQIYCWGVFRKHLRKKQQRFNKHTNNVEISSACLSTGHSHDRSEDIGVDLDLTVDKETENNKCEVGSKVDATGLKEMEKNKPKEIDRTSDMSGDKQTKIVKREKSGIKLDLTEDKETNRVKKCLAMLKARDSNATVSNVAPAVSFFTRSCSPNSADLSPTTNSPCKSATRAPAFQGPILDSPPGFPLDVPPGFTKAHSWLHTGETARRYIDSSSLVLDNIGLALDVPPGFTDAHRGLHTVTSPGSENGVSTVFSEKKPTIKFSLTSKRPVLTNVPPGFAKFIEVKKEPGLPAVCKATEKIAAIGEVNEMKIMHNKANADVQDSSEEREFPKTKQLSDILGSSASSRNNASTSKPPVPAAGTAKRLRVNGRIVLDRCAPTK